jgi:peptidyl-dipeptidase Dcp
VGASAGSLRRRDRNTRLAALNVAFRQNELADEEEEVLAVDEKNQLTGLPPALIEAAAAEAERRGLAGYAFANTRSAMEPLLTFAEDPALRERAFRIWTRARTRGTW